MAVGIAQFGFPDESSQSVAGGSGLAVAEAGGLYELFVRSGTQDFTGMKPFEQVGHILDIGHEAAPGPFELGVDEVAAVFGDGFVGGKVEEIIADVGLGESGQVAGIARKGVAQVEGIDDAGLQLVVIGVVGDGFYEHAQKDVVGVGISSSLYRRGGQGLCRR